MNIESFMADIKNSELMRNPKADATGLPQL